MKPGKINSYKTLSDIEINNKKFPTVIKIPILFSNRGDQKKHHITEKRINEYQGILI